jgi:hypothetical protein
MAAMTPRWRTTLRLRALLRLLLEKHVPMGTLDELVAFVASFSDSVLVDEQRRTGGSEDTGHSVPRLARDLSVPRPGGAMTRDAADPGRALLAEAVAMGLLTAEQAASLDEWAGALATEWCEGRLTDAERERAILSRLERDLARRGVS